MTAIKEKDDLSITKGAELYESVFQKFLHIREDQQEAATRKQLIYFHKKIDFFRQQLTDIHNHQPNKTDRLINNLIDYDTKYNSLIKGLNEPFMLFVVGTGNYGKSTLINALLETEAAAVDFRPKTWKIDIFQKDLSENQVVIKYRNGQKEKVSAQKAKELIDAEERKRHESERLVTSKLKEQKKQISSYEAFKELKLKLEREEIYNSDIVEMHWGMKTTPILENFYIVDTPGLTQTVMGEVRNNVQDYYHKADGVLWMLDATSIAASNAKKLVEELEESLAKVGGKQQQNIIAVLNRIDLIHKNQGEEGVKRVLADAEAIFKGYFRTIIPFSAIQAFEGSTTNNTELVEKSGMNKLQREVHSAFYKNAKSIQASKKLESSSAYNQEINSLLLDYIQDLQQDLERYAASKQQIDTLLHKESEKLLESANILLIHYQSRVEENLKFHTKTAQKIENKVEQKQFIEKEIFEVEHLSGLLKDFQRDQNQVFTNLTNHLIKKIYFTEYPNLYEHVALDIHDDLSEPINLNFNGFDDLLTIVLGIIGGIVSIFTGGLGGVFGGLFTYFTAKSKLKENFRTRLDNQLETIIEELTTKMAESVTAYTESAKKEIITRANFSFGQVYSFDHLTENNQQWENNVSKLIDEGKALIDSVSKPAPNYYPSLKESLL